MAANNEDPIALFIALQKDVETVLRVKKRYFQYFYNPVFKPLLILFKFSISTPMEYGFSALHDQMEASPLKTEPMLKGIFSFLKDCKLNSIGMDAATEKFKESNDPK